MHNLNYDMVMAVHRERMERYRRGRKPLEPGRNGIRRRVGHNLIHIGERLAGVDQPRKLGEAA